MTTESKHREQLDALRGRLAEAEEMLRAIRHGEIDALVVEGSDGSQVYTLHSADEPYRRLVEQMQEGALVLTSRGDILYSNAQFAALVGEPLESIVGSRFHRFVHSSATDEFEALLGEDSGRRRSSLRGAGARAFEVALSLTRTGSPSGDRLNLIVTDLTEMLDAQTNRVRAEHDSRSKDEFLATLAHELRTPIGAISNAAQVLELSLADGERTARAHEVIARQVAHISHLINDLLDVERVVSGKVRLLRMSVNLEETVKRVVGLFTANEHLDRRIVVSTEPVWVDGDVLRLEQVLVNIVTNAVKYTPAAGQIRITLHAEGGEAVITVEDNGLGISPRLLPFIFDRYVQADRTLDRSQGGLGIGLMLVRRLVELHGGTIDVVSGGEGLGSRFTMRLKQIPPSIASPAATFQIERRAKPRRVLLIEDSADAREMLRMMLELAGHVVYDAPDGERGLELLNVMRPDVGIIDIGLPRMDGYQIARRIRDEPHGRDMLLVALTGYGAPDDVRRSEEHGFDHHLVKPIDPEQIARLIGGAAENLGL
jgi:signal transduction histidine kinase/ActR/RegA family two-component response regulator